MVEQEVKKRTRVYATVAVLAAMILVSLIFVFGSAPSFTPNTPLTGDSGNGDNGNGTPSTNPNTNPNTNPSTNPTAIPSESISPMKQFKSIDELKNYLNANSATSNVFGGGPLDSQYFSSSAERSTNGASPTLGVTTPQTASPTTAAAPSAQGSADTSYSTTNVQVAGVDEADTTKNDGSYIYTESNDNAGHYYVCIVSADPSNPRVVAKIPLDNNTYLAGMFLSQDRSKLVVIGSQYWVYPLLALPTVEPTMGVAISPIYNSEIYTFVNVYNIADKAHPTLAQNYTLTGSYFNSRMIGDYVYAVVSQSAYVYNGAVPLPRVYTPTSSAEIQATSVYYSDTANFTDAPESWFTFTSFYGINLKDTSQLTNMTVLMGGASTMYVSLGNMYITYPTWTYNSGSVTAVYRVSIDNGKLTFQAKGGVPGNVINQYSMDEDKGYFRMATTNWKDTTQNAVYVLNMNLTTVGSLQLQNTEVRETIQSARFMGNKAYIVTFQQKDPFFVLDMSNPAAPKVAGKLEIPGYSSYLHPYDENHIIGLGMENSSLKLSLFDVTNVNAPREIAKYTVQGDYSYSAATYDPKAFLFDLSKQLLVIPVSATNYGVVGGSSGGATVPPAVSMPDSKSTTTSTQFSYWEGAYVFKVTTAGFELRGQITHQTAASTSLYYYGDYNLNINRALYIGNTLYTVSNAKVKLNSLTDLSPIAEVNLT
jgi:inhibitor of cysteine peptidase